MGRPGGRISCPSQTQARRANEREREAGADEATNFPVRPLPLGREARGELLRRGARFSASQAIYREHEGSEGSTPSQAGLDVLILLLLLVLGQDLVRVLASVGGRVGIRDTDVKDCRRAPPPESVDGHIAAEFWRFLCAGCGSPCVAVPTSVDEGFVSMRNSPRKIILLGSPLIMKVART